MCARTYQMTLQRSVEVFALAAMASKPTSTDDNPAACTTDDDSADSTQALGTKSPTISLKNPKARELKGLADEIAQMGEEVGIPTGSGARSGKSGSGFGSFSFMKMPKLPTRLSLGSEGKSSSGTDAKSSSPATNSNSFASGFLDNLLSD